MVDPDAAVLNIESGGDEKAERGAAARCSVTRPHAASVQEGAAPTPRAGSGSEGRTTNSVPPRHGRQCEPDERVVRGNRRSRDLLGCRMDPGQSVGPVPT